MSSPCATFPSRSPRVSSSSSSGPSGSGKSTFLKLLLRDEVATDGRVLVAGRDIARLGTWKVPQLRRNIGCVFQDFKLLTNKTVYENVAFALEVIGRPKHIVRTQVPQILDLVGLSKKAESFPTELSGGEQQRVSIARAFVNRPLILLADEPSGNLDPATTVGIMRLLDRINRTGTTVVMATHDQRIVDAMRRRVLELDHGQLVRDQARGVYGVGELTRCRDSSTSRARRWISLRRNLLMTLAGIMTVAVSLTLVRRHLARAAPRRPRHQPMEERRRARDLHERRRQSSSRSTRSKPSSTASSPTSRCATTASSASRTRTRSSSGSSTTNPRSSRARPRTRSRPRSGVAPTKAELHRGGGRPVRGDSRRRRGAHAAGPDRPHHRGHPVHPVGLHGHGRVSCSRPRCS